MTNLIRALVAVLGVLALTVAVEARPGKATSDVSAKYRQYHDGIAQNFR